MNPIRVCLSIIKSPQKRFYYLKKLGFYDDATDEFVIKQSFKLSKGYELNLSDPETFNEKIQWLKLNDRNDTYSTMVDKCAAKEYVARIIGDEYIIPTLGVWDTVEDIDFSGLPEQFVLKCTHDSGGLVICRDKGRLDVKKAKRKLSRAMKNNYYLRGGREWPYKNVPHRIIAEQYMQDGEHHDLRDYKFYCFNGIPRFLYLSEGLEDHSTARISFVNMDWTFASFGRSDYKPFDKLPPKPEQFGEMVEIAKKLSKDIAFVRVDLYVINGRIYFGELTFSPCGGLMPFDPPEADMEVGKLLDLSNLRN